MQVLEGLVRLTEAANSANLACGSGKGGRIAVGSGHSKGHNAAVLEEEVQVDAFVKLVAEFLARVCEEDTGRRNVNFQITETINERVGKWPGGAKVGRGRGEFGDGLCHTFSIEGIESRSRAHELESIGCR